MNHAFIQAKATVALFGERSEREHREDRTRDRVRTAHNLRRRLFAAAVGQLLVWRQRLSAHT